MAILGTLLLNVCQVHCHKPFTDISAHGSPGNSDLCTAIIAESAPTVCGHCWRREKFVLRFMANRNRNKNRLKK